MGATGSAWQTYLASGVVPGLGPGLAARMVAAFGDDLERVLDGAPHRLVREVPGLRPAVAAAVESWWRKERRRAQPLLALLRAGLPLGVARRALAAWGPEAAARVRRDPYALMGLSGVGWATADAAAHAQGIGADDPRRWRAALEAVLEQAQADGHCGLSRAEWVRAALALIGQADPQPVPDSDRWVVHGEWVAPADLYRAERDIERRWILLNQARGAGTAPSDGELRGDGAVELTAAQRQAVRLALTEPVSVLTGLPGTGKTTIVRAAVRLAEGRGERVMLMAPTGKAAKRLADVTGVEARTIHRALGWRPAAAGRQWTYHEGAPLPADFVVVDEASMLDVRLARRLLKAVAPGTRLLLVGDPAQLPSVGPGRVLADAIEHGAAPVTRLQAVQRQAADSPIVRLAHAVHAGRWPEVSAWRDPRCQWIEASAEEAAGIAARCAADAKAGNEELVVLTAMHKGPDGVEALNRAIREAINPGADGWRGFRLGDRVMQTKNNAELDVVNGEDGIVRELAPGRVVVEFDGRTVTYVGAAASELELAYALTVHKSQGSEWPAVAVVLTRRQYVMAQRALLYTAITRARERLVLIGDAWAYRVAAATAREQRRGTMLFRYPNVVESWGVSAPCRMEGECR